MSFVDHLEALRWHIVRSVLAIMIIAIALFIKMNWIFDKIIMGPLRKDFISYTGLCNLGRTLHMGDVLCMPPIDIKMQTTTFSSQFISSITIAFIGGFIVAFPYIFWEFWRFLKPALSPKELKSTRGAIFWVSFFFLLGIAFGYFLLAPFTFSFLANYKLGAIGSAGNQAHPGRLYGQPGGYPDRVGTGFPVAPDELCADPHRSDNTGFLAHLPEICLCGDPVGCSDHHALTRLDEPNHRCASTDPVI